MNFDHKELLRHSGNYLFAVVANKALSFISIPVYTYLLSVDDYGVLNVFNSTAQVAAVFLTLNTEVAISRYYYDAKNEEDFKRFVGTSICFSFAIFVVLSAVLVLFSDRLANYMGFEKMLVLCLVPYALILVLDGVFQQIFQPLLKSKLIAIVSSITVYSGFAISVVLVLLMPEKRYYGIVCGSMLMALIVGIYKVLQIRKHYSHCFETKYLRYILNFTLPYLPYSLSGIIIAQFGKMIIGQQDSFNSAGLYSFAHNLSGLMMILIVVVHQAWNPYYFRYMKEGNYKTLDGDYNIIWKVTLIFGAFLSLYCYEIGFVLARPQYLSALYLVPFLVLGYLFYQWSYVYLRNTSYEKKVIWNAIIVVSSGVVNLLLNTILIKSYHSLGVAVSFAVSYAYMLCISWLVNKYILRTYATCVNQFLKPLIAYLPIIFISYYCKDYVSLSFSVISVKFIILIMFTFLITKKQTILWLKSYLHS